MDKRRDNIYIEKDSYYILRIESLKHGIFDFKIDKEDYIKCKKYHWNVNLFTDKKTIGKYYALNSKIGLLHRFILNAQKSEIVDHANGDSLDTTKGNIRICSRSDNNRNRKCMKNNTSGHIGVSWNSHIPTPKWMAYIKINNKRKHIGYFDKLEDAIKARQDAEKKYYGDFAPSIIQ